MQDLTENARQRELDLRKQLNEKGTQDPENRYVIKRGSDARNVAACGTTEINPLVATPQAYTIIKNGKEHPPLKMTQFNARCLYNKYHLLSDFIAENDPDILVITDTWLESSISNTEFTPESYCTFRRDRNVEFYSHGTYEQEARGGGNHGGKSSQSHRRTRLFHAPTRTTSSGCFMLHRTVHALWNLYGNPYRNCAETEEETIP